MAVNQKKAKDEAPEEDDNLLVPPKKGEELFEGQAKSYAVTSDVNPQQLIEEVYERLGKRDKYQVVAMLEDDDAVVSEANPLVLHLFGDVDLRTVRGVVETHEKDDSFGISQEEAELNALADRLRSGEDLSAGELNKLMRSMLS